MPYIEDTILIHIFTLIDDFCKQYQGKMRTRGYEPVFKDSELITILLYTELFGVSSEREQHRFAEKYLKSYFPRLIDRTRFHRRSKQILPLINEVRKLLLRKLPVSDVHLIDSTPIPVITFQRACFTPLFPEAEFGRCAARRMTYYGFKLHLVTDKQGIPVHFDLTPANVDDRGITEELLENSSRNHTVLADKGYISQPLEDKLSDRHGITFYTPKRRNQKGREPKSTRKLLNKWRQRIETVNGILKSTFQLERTFAKTLLGLSVRIFKKITALTLAIYLNSVYDRNLLSIKSLVC